MVHTVYAVYHGFLQHSLPGSTGVVMAKISSKVGCEANPSLPLLKQFFARRTNKDGYIYIWYIWYIYICTHVISIYIYTFNIYMYTFNIYIYIFRSFGVPFWGSKILLRHGSCHESWSNLISSMQYLLLATITTILRIPAPLVISIGKWRTAKTQSALLRDSKKITSIWRWQAPTHPCCFITLG